MYQYKVVACKKEITSAIGPDMESFLTPSEFWSYDESQAKLFSEKEANQIVLEFSNLDLNKGSIHFLH